MCFALLLAACLGREGGEGIQILIYWVSTIKI